MTRIPTVYFYTRPDRAAMINRAGEEEEEEEEEEAEEEEAEEEAEEGPPGFL